MQKELLVAKRKKARELHQKGWSIDKIVRHLVSCWIEMDSIEEDTRGWEKGRLRKYDKQIERRVIDIRDGTTGNGELFLRAGGCASQLQKPVSAP